MNKKCSFFTYFCKKNMVFCCIYSIQFGHWAEEEKSEDEQYYPSLDDTHNDCMDVDGCR